MEDDNKKESCSKCKCENCCKEIPESTAFTSEGSDYISHFCGTECYEKWLKSQQEKQKKDNQSAK
ncbi:DUF3330 domain-containing protein [Legionella israelensis]|uniref:DUF3330 domain-containing protein n=1 Tax=Legionella israelensis TaxID=454 RepID=UPI00117D78B6|nr:DUF3330 domain-containing protein [Legionella israelensis]QDP71410.1 DUF3330 domain-containing protein [Legionella israelensis]